MKKITLTTVKSFISKNTPFLFVNFKSSFDGMTDGIEQLNGGFQDAKITTENTEYNLGVAGAHFVKSSRDYFSLYEDPIFLGVSVSNSCGRFILAVKKGTEGPISQMLIK